MSPQTLDHDAHDAVSGSPYRDRPIATNRNPRHARHESALTCTFTFTPSAQGAPK